MTRNDKNAFADKMIVLCATRSIFGETNVQMSRLKGGQWMDKEESTHKGLR